jgi:hypothetical protein
MQDKNNQQVNELKHYAQKGNLKRNDKCPCGSGKKVKVCHKHFLEVRHYVVQREFQITNGIANYNRTANLKGHKTLNREQYIDALNEAENQAKLNNNEQKSTENVS